MYESVAQRNAVYYAVLVLLRECSSYKGFELPGFYCRRVAMEMLKALYYLVSKSLNGYFKGHQYAIITRGNHSFVALMKMRTETGQQALVCQGARIFNRLGKTIRDEASIL